MHRSGDPLQKALTFDVSDVAGARDLQLAQVVDADRVVLQGANVPEISRRIQRQVPRSTEPDCLNM